MLLNPFGLGDVIIMVTDALFLLAHGQTKSALIYRFDGTNWIRMQ